MTNTIVLGSDLNRSSLKKIEFRSLVTRDFEMRNTVSLEPYNFANIELICKNYRHDGKDWSDLMFAYDENRYDGILYFGNWNDGVV